MSDGVLETLQIVYRKKISQREASNLDEETLSHLDSELALLEKMIKKASGEMNIQFSVEEKREASQLLQNIVENSQYALSDVQIGELKTLSDYYQTTSNTQETMISDRDNAVSMGAHDCFVAAQQYMMPYIAQFESIRLQAYRAPEGNPTIGFGNLKHPDGRPVKMGDRITVEQAMAYLVDFQEEKCWKNLEKYGIHVDKMTQSDFVAIGSLVWNCGGGVLKDPLATKLNNFLDNRDDPNARNALREEIVKHRYYHKNVKGKRVRVESEPLYKRRELETAILFGDIKLTLDGDCQDSNAIRLNNITLGVFNLVSPDKAHAYDCNMGTYTAALDTVNDCNRYKNGPTYSDVLEKLGRESELRGQSVKSARGGRGR